MVVFNFVIIQFAICYWFFVLIVWISNANHTLYLDVLG